MNISSTGGAFRTALAFTLRWEGGDRITSDPADPGGLTKFGISQRAYPNLDIKGLTEQDAAAIYAKDYWYAAGCDKMDTRLALCVFDAAVNHGVNRAVGFLKQSDANACSYLTVREQFYRAIVARRPESAKFLKGWLNRVNALRKECMCPSSP